jgi:hypothetical protein
VAKPGPVFRFTVMIYIGRSTRRTRPLTCAQRSPLHFFLSSPSRSPIARFSPSMCSHSLAFSTCSSSLAAPPHSSARPLLHAVAGMEGHYARAPASSGARVVPLVLPSPFFPHATAPSLSSLVPPRLLRTPPKTRTTAQLRRGRWGAIWI